MAGRAEFFPISKTYRTNGGIDVHRTVESIPVEGAVEPIIEALDSRLGVLLASSVEQPGRYARWDIGFVDPPVSLTSQGRRFRFQALNARGRVMLAAIRHTIGNLSVVAELGEGQDFVWGSVTTPQGRFPEEQRSRQPSIFSVLRAVIDLFGSTEDPHLGLYGAFGYDLALQFEPLRLRLERSADQRDLVLYIPDQLVVVDHRLEQAARCRYDFEVYGSSTQDFPREGVSETYTGKDRVERACDHDPGEYAAGVRRACEAFQRGDLFEVVPGQTFFEPCLRPPSTIFNTLRERNPAPYGFLINLGRAEHLVGASPEMYVRVSGARVETCPIAGTVPRGVDAITDADQIRRLLCSTKDEAELTMCTDVDRNDKSRVCEPGSVRVLARRQIEMYSRLIHTVDHVEGILRHGFDALDAFLAHAWAVTVTGAPKAWAMQFLEDHEKSARGWYGGAIGQVGFDGNMNTGLTLRTIQIKDGIARVRAGATLLYGSDPDEEEQETRVKASALIDAIRRPRAIATESAVRALHSGRGKRILLVDHQDSFVHTLANYLRQTGAEVVTWRARFPAADLDELKPDLMVLSPGPGRPKDFAVDKTLDLAVERGLPVFGVCLGLQGIVEYFGGELGQLARPAHGKASRIRVRSGRIFEGLPPEFFAGRYHSLYGIRETLPAELRETAESDDGVIMALEHVRLPMAGVQFHPESILTLGDDIGLRLIRNVVAGLQRAPPRAL